MSGFKRSGESFFVSYRDPHLRRTLDVFKGIPEYVRSFKADEREMTKYIIGTISGKDVEIETLHFRVLLLTYPKDAGSNLQKCVVLWNY